MCTNSQSLKRNRLKRVLQVQNEFEKVKGEGQTKKKLYYKYFREKWSIEYHTFINYLGEDARGKLEALEIEIKETLKNKPAKPPNRIGPIRRRLAKLERREAAQVLKILLELHPDLAPATKNEKAPTANERPGPKGLSKTALPKGSPILK